MNETNSTSGDLRVDRVIDDVVARRKSGSAAGEPALTRLSSDEALIVELSALSDIDWPADEVGDRIAISVAAAAGQHAASVPGPAAATVRDRRQRAGARHVRSDRSRWLAVGAAAAAALVAGAFLLTGGPHGATRHISGPSSTGQRSARVKSPDAKASGKTPASLTAMTVVGRSGALAAVGAVGNGDSFLTCVTRSICYIAGHRDGGKHADIARSVDGGATWTAGAALPVVPNPIPEWNADLSCPTPQRCFSAYESGLLETSDGFAHVRFQPVTQPSGYVEWVSCPTTQHCVAVVLSGKNGKRFIYSGDGGRTWATASAPVVSMDDTIAQLRCDRDGACIAAVVGGDESSSTASALSSTDGGRSWIMSASYSTGGGPQWLVSCGDGRNCVVGSNDGLLAWVHVTASGRIRIRIQAFPKSWPTTGVNVSCPTGRDCFLEIADVNGGGGYGNNTIEATRDDGHTWTSLGTPMVPGAPQDVAASLSCPVAAGCIAVANDPDSSQTTWVVLSNLHNVG